MVMPGACTAKKVKPHRTSNNQLIVRITFDDFKLTELMAVYAASRSKVVERNHSVAYFTMLRILYVLIRRRGVGLGV